MRTRVVPTDHGGCTAELTTGRGIHVSLNLVTRLMHNAGIAGLPGPAKVRRIKGTPTADDLVERKVRPLRPRRTLGCRHHRAPHPRGQGLLLRGDGHLQPTHHRLAIDSVQDAHLVVNALDMAIQQRTVKRGSIVHADHGVQFTSWAFTDKVRRPGLMPSFGSVGNAFENAMMGSFWSTM